MVVAADGTKAATTVFAIRSNMVAPRTMSRLSRRMLREFPTMAAGNRARDAATAATTPRRRAKVERVRRFQPAKEVKLKAGMVEGKGVHQGESERCKGAPPRKEARNELVVPHILEMDLRTPSLETTRWRMSRWRIEPTLSRKPAKTTSTMRLHIHGVVMPAKCKVAGVGVEVGVGVGVGVGTGTDAGAVADGALLTLAVAAAVVKGTILMPQRPHHRVAMETADVEGLPVVAETARNRQQGELRERL